ncbi:HNH endonuclease [compost metagenome]
MEREAQRNREYKIARQDKDIQAIYNSKTWKITVRLIANRDKNLCRLCLSEKRISYYNTVHHIVELKEDITKAFIHGNLISLCESCHQKVHKAYKISKTNKQQMQEILFKILKETPRGV